jgi:hypothetical protein
MKVLINTLGFTAGLLMSGCSDQSSVSSPARPTMPVTPSTTTVVASTTPPNGANWIADATVVSSTGLGCGWGTTAGETRSGVWWRITQKSDSLTLDEDMPNWPTDDVLFSGSLNGTHFTAADVEAGGGVCMFLGGTLTGSFSDDGLSFDASETLLWGPPANPVRVQRHWVGRRL